MYSTQEVNDAIRVLIDHADEQIAHLESLELASADRRIDNGFGVVRMSYNNKAHDRSFSLYFDFPTKQR